MLVDVYEKLVIVFVVGFIGLFVMNLMYGWLLEDGVIFMVVGGGFVLLVVGVLGIGSEIVIGCDWVFGVCFEYMML